MSQFRESGLRPPGSVEVDCSHPGCTWSFWISPTDPRLPDGPFYCGSSHLDDRFAQVEALHPLFGIRMGSRQRCTPPSPNTPADACGDFGEPHAGKILFHDKWWSRTGILSYDHLEELDDPFRIPDRIRWLPAGTSADLGTEQEDDKLPRMGGQHYRLRPDKSEEKVQLVLHRCPCCLRRIAIEEDHPLAYKGVPTCAHETGWGIHWGPCPAGPAAFALDGALRELHGPGTSWTIWHGGVPEAENAAHYYSKGRILVSRITGDWQKRAEFAVLRYDHTDQIARAATELRFCSLADLDLEEDEFGAEAREALRFTGSLPRI